MKEEDILDVMDDSNIGKSKWKFALIVIAFGTISFVSLLALFPHRNIMIPLFIVIILALYFFIKIVGVDFISQKELFLWSTFMVFSIYLFSLVLYHFIYTSIYDKFMYNYITEGLLLAITFGYIPAIGVFQFVKNKNWAMLILMIFISWISITSFYFDMI